MKMAFLSHRYGVYRAESVGTLDEDSLSSYARISALLVHIYLYIFQVDPHTGDGNARTLIV